MGKFVITISRNGEYWFRLIADNDEAILYSDGYASRDGVLNGINLVKSNVAIAARFVNLTSSNGKAYFVLQASNGIIIGTSELYESVADRDNGIADVGRYAPDAPIEDCSS